MNVANPQKPLNKFLEKKIKDQPKDLNKKSKILDRKSRRRQELKKIF